MNTAAFTVAIFGTLSAPQIFHAAFNAFLFRERDARLRDLFLMPLNIRQEGAQS